jgi:endo-1,4-beta-D-glucanase Y
MKALYITLMTVWAAGSDELRERFELMRQDDPERGSVTLEQAIIGAALFLAAVGLVAVIVAAVNSRSTSIQ